MMGKFGDITESPGLARLRRMSSSPYRPEPPRNSVAVNFLMKIGKLLKRTNNYSPHLFKGSHMSKVEYEYNRGHEFIQSISGYVDACIFKGKDVLDIGCGWGGKTIYFAMNSGLKSIWGFDLPAVFLPEVPESFAKERSIRNCFFATGKAEEIPFENESFDLLIMDDVLEHVTCPERVLHECYRVLRPEGSLIIKFPSFRMMGAHHLDRAIAFPGLHYLLSMKTWAAGLNYLLLQPGSGLSYEPFDEVISTQYTSCVTRNLNGLDYVGFCNIVKGPGFDICFMECVRAGRRDKLKRNLFKRLYHFLYDMGVFKEFFSAYILFVGKKPSRWQLSKTTT
jgi:2-polyprenyl-3-methyl-5-hydroxy-6-metoxy-1,4-benzoquinol methylase